MIHSLCPGEIRFVYNGLAKNILKFLINHLPSGSKFGLKLLTPSPSVPLLLGKAWPQDPSPIITQPLLALLSLVCGVPGELKVILPVQVHISLKSPGTREMTETVKSTGKRVCVKQQCAGFAASVREHLLSGGRAGGGGGASHGQVSLSL